MKRKMWVLLAVSLTAISLAGCNGNDNSDITTTADSSYERSGYDNGDLSSDNTNSSSSSSHSSSSSSSYSSSSSKTIEHYCEADGCYKEGTKTMTGFSGKTEYYCQSHYDEIQDIIGGMEEDVGNGSASKHQCEECSKEGTYELVGLSGATEYYCTEHYNQIVEILSEMLKDYNE